MNRIQVGRQFRVLTIETFCFFVSSVFQPLAIMALVLRRTFPVMSGNDAEIQVDIVEPEYRSENLTLVTWTSSHVLANQIHKFDRPGEATIPVLELGAGTGLVGLTAAKLWQKQVILTDLPGILPGLRANIDANNISQMQCGSLDWRSADLLSLEDGREMRASQGAQASVIFAADTIYDEDHPELLSHAILTWLARTSDSQAILCYPLRVAYLDYIREIWTILEEAGLEAVREGQERADEKDWDDECLCEWVVFKWKSSALSKLEPA